MKIIKHGSKYSEDKNSNFSLEAKFESMIKIAKKTINQNKNNTGDCSIETALAYDVANYLPKVLKENEELKEEKEQAWEEWNNLEQGSYETEQKLKQQMKELQIENEELKQRIREHTLLISPYYVEENYIPKQKVKDKIEEEKLPLVIVGGRSNKKTLEYGIKLGRRQALQELLESEEK